MRRLLHTLSIFTFFLAVAACAAPASFAQTAGKADYYLGLDLYHDKDYEGSARAFQSQLAKTPEDLSAQKWLTKALEKARESHVADLAPETPAAPVKTQTIEPQTDYERGVALYRDGQYAQAELAFEKSLEKNPKHVPTRQWLGLLAAHRPSVSPSALLDGRQAARKSLETSAPVAPIQPAPMGGNAQFGMEQNAVQVSAPVIPAPAPIVKPLSFGNKLKSIPLNKPTSTPVAPPASGQASAPVSSSDEVETLRNELAMRNEQIRRAIEQTKRAIMQTDEAERLNLSLSDEISKLRQRQTTLESELGQNKEELASLQQKSGKAPTKNSESAKILRLQNAITLREESVKKSREREKALLRKLESSQNEIDVMRRRSAATVGEKIKAELNQIEQEKKKISKALEAKEAELLKSRQSASAAQRQFDIRLGQLERTLQVAQERAQTIEKEKAVLENRLKSIDGEQGSVSKKLTQSDSQKETLQKRIDELAAARRSVEAELAKKTAEAADFRKTAEQSRSEKTALEAELKKRNDQIARAIAQTREAVAQAENLKTELNRSSGETKRLASSVASLEKEKTLLTRSLEGKDAAIMAARAEALDARQALKGSIEHGPYQPELARRLKETEATLTQVAASFQAAEDARGDAERRSVEHLAREKDLTATLSAKEKELAAFRATEASLQKTIQTLESRLASEGEDRASLVSARKAAAARADELGKSAKALESEIKSLAGERDELLKRLAESQNDLSQAREALKASQSDLAEIRAQSKNTVSELGERAKALQSNIESLGREREELIARVEASQSDLVEARQALEMSQSDLAEIRSQSEKTVSELEAQLVSSSKKLEIATQARAASEETLLQMKSELAKASETLENTERALGQTNRRYQAAEEARYDAERKLAEALENTKSLAAEINSMRNSEAALLAQIKEREQALATLETEHATQMEALRAEQSSRIEALEARATGAEATLEKISNNYHESEEARERAEKQLATFSQERDTIESELSELRGRAGTLEKELEQRDAALQDARAELAVLGEDTARERQEAASRQSHLENVLEESRAQGLLLAHHLEQERALRKTFESRVVQSESREAQTRAQIDNLRSQLNHTLPQLQAASASLDEITVKREISEGTIDEIRGE